MHTIPLYVCTTERMIHYKFAPNTDQCDSKVVVPRRKNQEPRTKNEKNGNSEPNPQRVEGRNHA